MSRPTSNKSNSPRKSGNPMLTGILLGMMFGVALAAGLAWYLLKSPSPFVNKVQEVVKPTAEVAKPTVSAHKVEPVSSSAPAAASGVEEAKPRFEFYKVLSDKQDAAAPVADKPKASDKAKAAEKAPAFPSTYLQAGSFANAEEAENLKASLAMKGVESSVQTVTIPDKGTWHRVRVGPFKSEKDMNNALATLKRNGINATPAH